MPVQKLTLQMTVMCDTDTLGEAVAAYDSMSLSEIEEATQAGDDIGSGVKVVTSETLMTPDRIRAELQAIGNDGEFFDMSIADMAESGDVVDTDQLGNQVPLFLTNGGCEYADNPLVRSKFEELSLEGRISLDGDSFFPLTDAESQYVSEDFVTSLDCFFGAMLGYSALYRNAKCLAPQIEFHIAAPRGSDEEQATLHNVEQYVANITPQVNRLGGEVQIDRGIDFCVVVRILIPIKKVMELGSPEDWKARLALLISDPTIPVYLTNACCEAAHGQEAHFNELGLSYGEYEGQFYPLTEDEEKFIAEDEVYSFDGRMLAMMGYTALYRGKKYFMPSIELSFGDDFDDFPPFEKVLEEAKAYAENINPKLATLNGFARVDDKSDDERIVIQMLFPVDQVTQCGDLTAWKNKLAWLMTDPETYGRDDIQTAIRVEDDEFAVKVSWIGEGVDGDFDPMRPDDVPYLRVDVEKRVGEDFEDMENASYCTQVPAYASPETRETLARYVLMTLDMGCTGKSDLECISEIDLSMIESCVRPTAGHTPEETAVYPGPLAKSLTPENSTQSLPSTSPDLDRVDVVYSVKASFVITAGAYDGIVDKQMMADLINSRSVHDGDIDDMTIIEVKLDDEIIARAVG